MDFPIEYIKNDGLDGQRRLAWAKAQEEVQPRTLNFSGDAKTWKGEKIGVYTGISYLAAGLNSGANLCRNMTKGCQAACLFKAGRGGMNVVQVGRLRKTYYLLHRQAEYLAQLSYEIDLAKVRAAKKGMVLAIRLNGTSDIRWSQIRFADGQNIFERHSDVTFYDYTKRRDIAEDSLIIPNYWVTFSRAETKANQETCRWALANGINVAVVFGGDLPETFMGHTVINGDESDVRYEEHDTNGRPVIIGLSLKVPAGGGGEKSFNGFVVPVD